MSKRLGVSIMCLTSPILSLTDTSKEIQFVGQAHKSVCNVSSYKQELGNT